MQEAQRSTSSAFHWNAGGWFGSQLGCTLWLLILGALLLNDDAPTGWVSIGSFAVVNVWGLRLWRSRARLSAYAGIQLFLLVASGAVGLVVGVAHLRGVSEPAAQKAMVSTELPYWLVLVAPALMLMFYLRERGARKGVS